MSTPEHPEFPTAENQPTRPAIDLRSDLHAVTNAGQADSYLNRLTAIDALGRQLGETDDEAYQINARYLATATEAVMSLDHLDAELLSRRYGLSGLSAESLPEIAEATGQDLSALRQAEAAALERLGRLLYS